MTSTSLHIRRATPPDAAKIAPLFNAYRVFYTLPPDPDGAFYFIQERLERADSVILIAEDAHGRVLGFAQLYPSFSSLRMHRTFILNDLYVSEAYREQGIGEKIVRNSIDLARHSNASAVNLETAADNFPAQRLYEKLGFSRDEAFFHYELRVSD